jgi:hypothetical protein
MSDVTVVLNGYKRPYALKEQYEAYSNQSVGKPEFMFWANLPDGWSAINFDKNVVDNCISAFADRNHGVWARFAYALNAKTPYVCVADDDTIPGSRWLENCLQTMQETKESVLTTRGIRFKTDTYPSPESYEPIGWCNPNEETELVDFGGHCWFFHIRLLKAFWLHSPDILPLNFGEDINLSYAAWAAAGINTYVPKHPKDDTSLWGSTRDKALEYGEDMMATSRNPQASAGMNDYYRWIMSKGYVQVKDRKNGEEKKEN